MKKRILIVCYGLGIGGIEKCLVNLLNQLDRDVYEVDVLLMNPEYDLKEQIKRKVNYIDSFQYVFNTTDAGKYVQNHLNRLLPYVIYRLLVKLGNKPWKVFKGLDTQYDIAIAYSQNDYSPYYVIDKINADKKIMWYHNGAYEKSDKYYEIDRKYFENFYKVVTVSEDSCNLLKEKFSHIRDNIIVLHNLVDKANIIEMANQDIPNIFKDKDFKIVTVGRMTQEKGVLTALMVANKLFQEKIPFKWYWIGDGNQRSIIEEKINKYDINKYFILLGSKINPYKYINYCNLYVQPSHYEAYCTTTNEARILGKVIVATNVGGMKEQIANGETGFIVDNTVEELYEKVKLLIFNSNLLNSMQNKVRNSIPKFDGYIKEYNDLFK